MEFHEQTCVGWTFIRSTGFVPANVAGKIIRGSWSHGDVHYSVWELDPQTRVDFGQITRTDREAGGSTATCGRDPDCTPPPMT